MSKAGQKLLKGAHEAIAIVRGEKMPARVTAFGWILWHPLYGFEFGSLMGSKVLPNPTDGWKNVRVKIETVPSTGKGK